MSVSLAESWDWGEIIRLRKMRAMYVQEDEI